MGCEDHRAFVLHFLTDDFPKVAFGIRVHSRARLVLLGKTRLNLCSQKANKPGFRQQLVQREFSHLLFSLRFFISQKQQVVRSKGSSARLDTGWDKGYLCPLGIQLNIGNPAHRALHTFSTQQVGKLHKVYVLAMG